MRKLLTVALVAGGWICACSEDPSPSGGAAGTSGAAGQPAAGAGGAGSSGASGAGSGAGGAGQAGAGGDAGSGGAAFSLAAGVYELTPTKTFPLGSYAFGASGPKLQLILEQQGKQFTATVSAQGESSKGLEVDIDATRAYIDEPSSLNSNFQPHGPVELKNAGPVDSLALQIDEQGRPEKALARDYYGIPGLLCTQNSSGDYYAASYVVTADTTPPELKATGGPMPWQIGFTASEPNTRSEPTVTGAASAVVEGDGLSYRVRPGGDLFALLGSSLKLEFAEVSDVANNKAPASLTWTFDALEAPVEGKDYGTTPACVSAQAIRLKKAGATKLVARMFSDSQSFNLPSLEFTVTSSDGKQSIAEQSSISTEVEIEIDLPADDVVLQWVNSGCQTACVRSLTLK